MNEPLNPSDLPVPPPTTEVPVDVPTPPPVEAVEAPAPGDTPSESALPVADVAVEPAQVPTEAQVPSEVVHKGEARPLPQTLTAARDAAAFVAQLFAEVSAPEPVALAAVEAVATPPSDEAAAVVRGPSGEQVVSPLRDQQVLILGLGASGLAMARWCVRLGARVTVVDTREAPPQLAALRRGLPDVDFRRGSFDAVLVSAAGPSQGAKAPSGGSAVHEVTSVGANFRAVFKSPGLSPAAVAPVWQAAQAMGLWVGGELDLFARALRDLQAERGYAPKVLAVTGTNGKTTVTALTGQLVEHAGKTVAVAGNIGLNLLDALIQRLDAGTLPEVWVLELSSFQLDGVQGFEPSAAVVLNLTQDHLDWHGDMQKYGAAKARVFGSKGLMVLNRDDAAVMAMLSAAGPSQGAKAPLGGSDAREAASVGAQKLQPVRVRLQKPQWREYVSFGLEMPQRPSDYGIETVNGMAWLVRAMEADETVKTRRPVSTADVELHIQRLMPADALRIQGRHNATNALAALALAQAAGCALAPMLYGLREYRGEPHRVESIGVVQDVEFFDDSKGTNVGATVAALAGLGADRRIIVILGGEGKGQDFTPLAAPVARHARAVVLIGRDAPVIRAALEGTGVPLLEADSMDQAVRQAQQRAHASDAVLLSPACASFDMFDNYEHRARVFAQAVQALALESGVVLEHRS